MGELVVHRMADRAAFEAVMADAVDAIAYEEFLQRVYSGPRAWNLPAICHGCGNAVALIADNSYSFDGRVNFRERLECPVCGLNTRQRFVAHLMREFSVGLGRAPRIYLHEQVTPFFTWATAVLEGEIVGSEYLGPDIAGGTVIDGVRHEDALALSFGDRSFDLVVSQDVLEHVPDIDRALSEAARVLAPEGRLLISVPFNTRADVTRQRAALRDGELVHMTAPAFHANPMSDEGSLVFYDHGWDLLDRLRSAGFSDVAVLGVWSAHYGYLCNGLLTVLTATR